MTVIVLVLYVLSAMRLTRLINYDRVFDPIRNGLVRAFHSAELVTYFLTCPWCVGLWLSALAAVPTAHVLGWSWWAVAPLALASSMLIGLAAPLSEDDEMEIEDVVAEEAP